MKYIYRPNGYIQLLPGSEVVKGINRAVLLSASTNSFEIIPLALADMITTSPKQTLEEIYGAYGIENKSTIESYLEFIISRGIAFISSSQADPMCGLPEVYEQWDAPFMFTNAIIDFNSELEVYYMARLKELAVLGCDMLQLRFFQEATLTKVFELAQYIYQLNMFNGLSIVASSMCFKFWSNEALEEFVARCPIITEIILFGANGDEFFNSKKYRFKILRVSQHIDEKSCGAVLPFYFATNIASYSESFSHNSCLNRKVGVDRQGFIKNCPSMTESFGNIQDTTLIQATEHPNFRNAWFITKDQVDKCSSCEFRKVCTDCRAFLDIPSDIYSAPLKCGYNPYTCEWEDWATNSIKKIAITEYGL